MNPRHILRWLLVVAALFAFILISRRFSHQAPAGPVRMLPRLKAAAVTAVQVMPKGQLPIRAERTNNVWQLSKPLAYSAQSVSVENLLAVLEGLTPVTHISESEIKNHFNADQEYGFSDPQATITIEQGDYCPLIHVGAKTAPGDQLFVQVVGVEGAYVVDADFLTLLPRSASDWRDTTLVNVGGSVFDRIGVTNGAKVFVLQNCASNHLWRMVWPFEARADTAKVEASLQDLENLRIQQFVSDDPKADLEAFGLQPAGLELALGQGTNTVALLQFGKSPTNDARQVYARRLGRSTIVTVPSDLLAPWRGPRDDFRDPHLVRLTNEVQTIDVRAEDAFSVQRQGKDSWRIVPQNLPADAGLVNDLLSVLTGAQVGFAQDNVTELGLAASGLASPQREYFLKSAAPSPPGGATNPVIVDLSFGTNRDDVVFARRADERSVYAVKRQDFDRLPGASWQLRERRIWTFSENDVAKVTIRQQGKVRVINRKARYQWSLAPGSQGIIDDLQIEETVRGLVQMTAVVWVAQGEQNRSRYGFTDQDLRITLELKNGDSVTAEFGGQSPSTFPYAAVTLDSRLWILEVPPKLCRDILLYLAIPSNVP
jgi:hypothetical protein